MMGRGGSVVGLVPCFQKVGGSNPNPPSMDLGQVLQSQLPVGLRCVNSGAVSLLKSGANLSSRGLDETLQKNSE